MVDPRACGVDVKVKAGLPNSKGGSPRMRGRLAAREERKMKKRWIPAHAG